MKKSRWIRRWLSLGALASGAAMMAGAGARVQEPAEPAAATDAQTSDSLIEAPAVLPADPRPVYVIPINGEIEKALYLIINRALNQAERDSPRAIIFDMNTLGGAVNSAMMIRDRIINFERKFGDGEVPTYTYVNNRAISAGAFIALATDNIVMAPGSNIGAALPITIGRDGPTAADKKFISFFASEMRKTAKHNGHPEEIAEAFSDPDVRIRGLVARGDLLTLDDEEALEYDLAEFRATTLEDLLLHEGLAGAPVINFQYTRTDAVARFLVNPVISSLLLLLGVGGLFFEVKTPGFGVPGGIGLMALFVYFFGAYMANLSGYMEMIFFLIGLGLLVTEFFVIPGFGVFGIAGIVVMTGSLFFALFNLAPSGFGFPTQRLVTPLWTLVGSMLASVPMIAFLSWVLPQTSFYQSAIALAPPVPSEEERENDAALAKARAKRVDVGDVGVAMTDLRPSGVANFAGRRFDVLSEGDFIARGAKVEVNNIEGNRIFVHAIDALA